ncbi:MAG: tRNA (N(6)-L-threonylcarbamoyladenosine(37)-C(2))-methylthiotransferase MtaB [Candidatus Rokubacteria bacterium]|nr:tRNA (N(6)-L-threonylcarbamoyladenosine(37)-C(2))-methylthiotransferase MtaB [Candidatus Rokubacteria bacterium]
MSPQPLPVLAPAPPEGMATVAFATLGCRLNQYESWELQALLEGRGLRTVPFEAPADIYVINTCTVTARADYSDRQAIRRAVARNPNALVVVTGCYAQTNPGAIARIDGVNVILGNQEKYELVRLLDSVKQRVRPLIRVGEISRARTLPAIPVRKFAGHTRAFVKIQDGCQHRCSFCIVPYARGPSRSQPVEVVVDRLHEAVEAGYPEVVLTGVDMGHYGWDLAPRTTLARLLGRLLEVPGLRRLRLSSVLPAYFTDELIEVIAGSERICRHLHIPLQSGADRVLRAMRRPYNARIYRGLVERLAAALPDLGLGADLITGFPGETQAEFEETVGFVEALQFTYLHVFSYSDRPGTEAVRLPGHVAPAEIKRRTTRLRALGRMKQLAFRRAHLGREVELLVLEQRDRATGLLTGLTGNYIEVAFPGPESLMRGFTTVRVTEVTPERTLGEVVGA